MASGSVSISQAAISSCPESSRVHLMACEIEHDGEAQVSSYFDTSVREEGKNSGVQNGEKGACYMIGSSVVVKVREGRVKQDSRERQRGKGRRVILKFLKVDSFNEKKSHHTLVYHGLSSTSGGHFHRKTLAFYLFPLSVCHADKS